MNQSFWHGKRDHLDRGDDLAGSRQRVVAQRGDGQAVNQVDLAQAFGLHFDQAAERRQ